MRPLDCSTTSHSPPLERPAMLSLAEDVGWQVIGGFKGAASPVDCAAIQQELCPMQFGLFGSANAPRHADPDVDSGQGYRQFVDYNIEAEALGYKSTFL